MATTTNFGWETPDDTDLVKDGAAAIRTALGGVDTSFVDLKGGTTGQVLSKASNTDLDYTWVTTDDANAIQNAIVDAKGDLIAASANDTPARLAVGANGETLVADSSTSTGLRYQGNFAAGKNKIINGDFGVWQRGTSFTAQSYNADRFLNLWDGSGATRTITRQTFTPGTAPVAGYEGQYFYRMAQSVAGTGGTYNVVAQLIENVQTFAGQTATFSFWAKADASRAISANLIQNFGTGGSAEVNAGISLSATLGTSWTRYSATVTLPSISGKTIGTSSCVKIEISMPNNTAMTIDLWGWQLEAGSVATAFQTATGTLQGELAACQRYYWRSALNSAYAGIGMGIARLTTAISTQIVHPVVMRVNAPTIDVANLEYSDGVATIAVGSPSVAQSSNRMVVLDEAVSGATQYRPYFLRNANNVNGYIGFGAEL